MISFRIDRRSGTAVYVQLGQQVRQAVRVGRLAPGDRLPTAREVAERSGINPNTVLRAYRDLEVAGLVEPRQGAGTFVCGSVPLPRVEAAALGRELADWVVRARAAGLDDTDIHALFSDVIDPGVSHANAG